MVIFISRRFEKKNIEIRAREIAYIQQNRYSQPQT